VKKRNTHVVPQSVDFLYVHAFARYIWIIQGRAVGTHTHIHTKSGNSNILI